MLQFMTIHIHENKATLLLLLHNQQGFIRGGTWGPPSDKIPAVIRVAVFSPVPPKMCMSICSMRYMMNVSA